MGQGSDTLDDCGASQADDDFREEQNERRFYRAIEAESQYHHVRQAKVGATVHCPWCRKAFIKTTYHKTFCSNQRTSPTRNCKDQYWNEQRAVREV